MTREQSGGRLAGILSFVLRVGQARPVVSLLTVAALGTCLATRHDLGRILLAGGLGVLGLSTLLFRDSGSRVLFGLPSLLLLAAYAWAGTESVRLELLIDGRHASASVGDITVSAELPGGAPGRVGLAISPQQPTEPTASSSALGEVADAARYALGANLAAGVDELLLYDRDGQPIAGPFSFWEPSATGEPPAIEGGQELQSNGSYWLLGVADRRDTRATLWLRNGGPPVTFLARLDEGLNGVAVQAWPDRRELSIRQLQSGEQAAELAGGYQTLRKPSLAGFQSLLREILRAWLVGLAGLGLGVLLAPIARLVPGPSDWLAPAVAGPIVAVLLALTGLLLTSWVASDVLERIPHVQDSVAYLFQAKTFALGRLAAPLPPFPEAFEHEFIIGRNGAWFSKYPPGYPVILMLGVLVGAPWVVGPIAAAATLIALYLQGRTLFGGGTGLLAVVLLLVSPFFIFMSGSMMAHPAGLLLATVGLWLVARSESSDDALTCGVAGLCLGWLVATRALTGLAVAAPAVGWLAARRLVTGRSLSPLGPLAVGFSWPVLGLLAYNRALTGDPFQNPFELWWSFDRVGFGPTVGMHAGHDLARGLWNTYANLKSLETDLFGWPTYLTLAFVLLPFTIGRAKPGDWLCGAVSLGLMAGYVSYWADGLMFGPRYYYEAASCLALLTARGIVTAAEATSGLTRSLLKRRTRPMTSPLFTVLVAALLAGNVFDNLPRQVELHRGYNYVSGSRLAMVSAAGLHRAIVFVPTSSPFAWWDYGSVFSANDPLLRADVIFARDLGPFMNQRTRSAFPERTAYLLADGQLNGVP